MAGSANGRTRPHRTSKLAVKSDEYVTVELPGGQVVLVSGRGVIKVREPGHTIGNTVWQRES